MKDASAEELLDAASERLLKDLYLLSDDKDDYAEARRLLSEFSASIWEEAAKCCEERADSITEGGLFNRYEACAARGSLNGVAKALRARARKGGPDA